MAHLKKIVWLLVVIGFVAAAPADDAAASENDSDEALKPSTYAFSFETENGQVRDENVKLDPQAKSSKVDVNVKGSYSFISADGYEYTVRYKANDKGYQPYVTAHKIKTDKDKPQ